MVCLMESATDPQGRIYSLYPANSLGCRTVILWNQHCPGTYKEDQWESGTRNFLEGLHVMMFWVSRHNIALYKA